MMRSVRDAFEAARLGADLIDGAVLVVEAALRGAPDDPAMLAYLGAHLAVLLRREREEVLARAHLASAHQADTLTADPIWAAQ